MGGALAVTALGYAFVLKRPGPVFDPQFHLPTSRTIDMPLVAGSALFGGLSAIRRVFAYSKSDFAAMAATILVMLGWGVELGIVSGVVLSLLLHLYRTSKPHVAIVGQVPGTEHYRNI